MALPKTDVGLAHELDAEEPLAALLRPDDRRYTIVAVTSAYATCLQGRHGSLVGQDILECISNAAWPAVRKNQARILSSLDRALTTKQVDEIALEQGKLQPVVPLPLPHTGHPDSWAAIHTPLLLADGEVAYIGQRLEHACNTEFSGNTGHASSGTLSLQTLKNQKIAEELRQHMGRIQDATLGLTQTVRHMRTVMGKPEVGLTKLLGLMALAENRERQAIARDLHDDLGQVLTAARIKLSTSLKNSRAEAQASVLAEIDELLAAAERSTRSLAAQLVPPMLYELGLMPALRWLFEEMSRHYGLRVCLVEDGAETPLSQDARAILYRCVREILINVAKHAQVETALVECSVAKGYLIICVCDEGSGFDPKRRTELNTSARPGLGLTSVAERLSYLGGSFNIVSQPGKGTTATLIAPLAEK